MKSLEWAIIQKPYKKRTFNANIKRHREYHLKIERKHLRAKERGPRRSQHCHLGLELLELWKKSISCLSHLICGTLLCWPIDIFTMLLPCISQSLM